MNNIIACNVLTRDLLEFNHRISPEWAVAYGYCQEHDRMAYLFAALDEHYNFCQHRVDLPIIHTGKHLVSCGDWVVRTEEETHG